MPDPLYFTSFIYSSVFPTEKTEACIFLAQGFEANNSFIYCLLPYQGSYFYSTYIWCYLLLSLHCCSHWEYRRYCLKIQQIWTGCNKQSISIELRRPEKGQWPILWERWKKMVSFEMSLEKGNCISWTWWYKTLQVEGNNMSRGRGHDLESYVYDLSKLVEIQCLRVMVRTKRWNLCCKQILISGPHIVNHAQKLSKVQNTPRKPSRTECRMTTRICEYFTEEIVLWIWYYVKK